MPQGGTWLCLKTFWVVTAGGGGGEGSYWLLVTEARDAVGAL